MVAPILATKLYLSPSRSKIVLRPRLIERLNKGLAGGRKLTLISAPAGFGKTTLISEWVASCGRPVAWLSLDEGDGDPNRFLTYIVAALRTVVPNVGEGVRDTLQSSLPAPIEFILTTLLNEISTLPDNFILVLDDYHLVDAKPVDSALTFLIDHQPPQMHLAITTREDPNIPLARLRVRNQLTEMRVTDLRFTPSEAAEFLNLVMALNLSPEDIATLDSRTEGWIAGLQLAALSMRDHQDVHGFVQSFAGDHQYIVDYLIEEVLQRQPEPVRNFLLQTAVLNHLTGSLCEAVTGQAGGSARLESLQLGNFFLIPLDDKRHWYRYHHLFADVLQMHLMKEQPDQIPALNRRASEWYEQNGLAADAIHHALAAQDFERVADLIERALPVMRQSRQEATLLGWLQALPGEVFKRRPVLSVHYAGTLLQNGHLEGVEAWLRAAEKWLDIPAENSERPIIVDEEEFQRLPGSIAMYHAAIALAQGDVANTMKHARKVLELAREDDDFMRGAASSMLGLSFWTSGDLETAYRVYAEGMAHLQKVGFISDVIGGSVTQADIRLAQGRLRDSMRIYEHGLQLAAKPGVPLLRGAADMHVGMSEIYLERNDLPTAMWHILQSKELGEFNGLPKKPYRWRIAMAHIYEAQGDYDEALALLNEAEPLYVGDFSPNVHPVQALKARVWIAQGRLAEALEWAHQNKLSAADDLNYLREFEHITLTKILLAKYKSNHSDETLHEAFELLVRLLSAVEEGGRMGSVIEILILQALANRMRGDIPAALIPLERALKLAEPEGYVRMFIREGSEMRQLLGEAAACEIIPAYAGELLSAFDAQQKGLEGEAPHFISPASSSLVEPLSQRELDILRLFKTELSGPEIAQELVIALSTVRTHTKGIYSKLNVNSRRGAVRRATELGLL